MLLRKTVIMFPIDALHLSESTAMKNRVTAFNDLFSAGAPSG